MPERFIPRGVIPAVLLPFDSQLQIDEPAYRNHLRDVIAVDGVTGLTVNVFIEGGLKFSGDPGHGGIR